MDLPGAILTAERGGSDEATACESLSKAYNKKRRLNISAFGAKRLLQKLAAPNAHIVVLATLSLVNVLKI